MTELPKPLHGIRVLDLSHVLAMPYATMVLGDLGAEVIKVERLGKGDDSRSFGPFKNGESAYFTSVNRNKLSLSLDLKQEDGKAVLRKLIAESDVLAENYRPGTMEKLGFSYQAVKALNPRIVYASISGFGHDSLHPGRAGYDIIAQAFGGLMSITGYPRSPPTRVGASIADIISGLFTVIGILGALRTSEKTGLGQRLDTAMVDCIMAALENAVVRYTVSGEVPQRIGSRHPSITPFDVYRTADGHVVIAAGNEQLWQRLCAGVRELEPLASDDRFKSNELRNQHQEELKSAIESWSMTLPSSDVVETVSARTGVPCAPVNDVGALVEDPNTAHRRMLIDFDHPVAGRIRTANTPINLSLTDCKQHAPPPALGQHTDRILSELLGYTQEEILALRKGGVIAQAAATPPGD